MATFIQSVPSLGTGTDAGTKPDDAGSLIRSAEWGIDNLLTDFIVQNEEISCETMNDTTQDQKGAVVSQLDYDRHWTLTLSVIGDTDAMLPEVGGTSTGTSGVNIGDTAFTYGGFKWKINSITYTGSYQDKKQWQITAERWYNFPAQS